MRDIRDKILGSIEENKVVAAIIVDDDGMIVETALAADKAQKLGLSILYMRDEGSAIRAGDEIVRFVGNPAQVAAAEDMLMGIMAKPSGIATAARNFVQKAGHRPGIVSGAWKKMPVVLKDVIRNAIVAGGVFIRMSRHPFVYLDKNYIRMLGGIRKSLEAVVHLADHEKVVQLKGSHADIGAEAIAGNLRAKLREKFIPIY